MSQISCKSKTNTVFRPESTPVLVNTISILWLLKQSEHIFVHTDFNLGFTAHWITHAHRHIISVEHWFLWFAARLVISGCKRLLVVVLQNASVVTFENIVEAVVVNVFNNRRLS